MNLPNLIPSSNSSHPSHSSHPKVFRLIPIAYSLLLFAFLLYPLSALCSYPMTPVSLQRPDFAKSIGWMPGDSAVVIPASVVKIPPFAFADCTDLKEVVFPHNSRCSEIGDYAFWGCSSLSHIELPKSLKVLRPGCFRECTALESISLPPELADINSFAFIYCTNLREVNFPTSLRHIGLNAFARCQSLEKALLPDGISELESYIFADCDSIRFLKLPGNRNLLGELIANCCTNLTEVHQPSQIPPRFDCESFLFSPSDSLAYSRCRLIVPAESIDAYRNAPGWCLFKNISAE